jgi:FSR family fosmidomycin resistance protein-like MFS transporter
MIADQSLTTEKFQSERVSTIALGHAVHDTYTAFLPSFLPLLIERYALSKTEASLLPFLTQAPSIFQPFIGYLGDRVGLRLLLFLGPAVTAIMMSLVGAAPTYSLAVVFLVIVGFSSAGFHAIGPAIAGRFSASRLGLGMSLWMAAGELGRTLGPLIAVAAIQGLGPQRLPWLMVIGILVSLAVYWNLRDVPAQPQQAPDPLPWREAWHLLRPVLLPVSALLITRALAQVAFSTFLPTFLTEEGASLWLAGGSLTIMEFAGIGGAFLGGSLSDRLGRKSVLIVAGIGAAIFTVAFLATTDLTLRLITLLGLGATMLSVTPILMALIQDHYPEQRALANGAFMAVNFVVGSLAMLGVGWLGDHLGLHTTYWLSAGFMILGLPIILALPENHHPRSR